MRCSLAVAFFGSFFGKGKKNQKTCFITKRKGEIEAENQKCHPEFRLSSRLRLKEERMREIEAENQKCHPELRLSSRLRLKEGRIREIEAENQKCHPELVEG